MKKRGIILFLFCCIVSFLSAQTLEEAKAMFLKGEYTKSKPVFKKYFKSQPANASYNYWYGVCCLKTNEPRAAIKPLELAVKKKIQNAPFFLAETYNTLYRFDDAVMLLEEQIQAHSKKKQPVDDLEKLLEKTKVNARMLKGVEEVCIIDSFVVDKRHFLATYKLSEESGKLFTYNQFFGSEGKNVGTVYETEIGNKIYYSERGRNKTLDIFTKNKMLDQWGEGTPLPGSINDNGNANYPFVLTDGITIYYASDNENSMGGYDIFVTRYNTGTDTFLNPENVGMPFNSPYNDYMFAVDEYNDLGWFASDRFQPADKVCIYVFIPNTSKQTYNYESMDPELIKNIARLSSISLTWKDKNAVKEAKERLEAAISQKPREEKNYDFEFIVNDQITYHKIDQFQSEQSKELFREYQQLCKDYRQQSSKLSSQRDWYGDASAEDQKKMSAAILDLEKRVEEMSHQLDTLSTHIRNEEIQYLKK